MRSLKGKTIILGVTGSVAAIKSAQLARLLKKEGATVRAVLTESGRQMLSKQQRSKLEKETGKPLQSQLFTNNVKKHVEREAQRKARGLHVDLAEKADLLLIAPATANTIANLSHGKTQDEHGNADLLHTIHLGMEPYKLAIAPAMHQQMWKHPATRKNLKILEKRGAKIIRPVSGKLASGDIGEGRMQEPKEIVRAVKKQLTIQESLKGKKILVNAGPTRVFIDEVRFISNPFSGALGHEIAKEAAKRGAEVVLLQGKSGKHVPPELEDLNVKCEYFDEPLETRRGVPSLMELMKKHVGLGKFDAIIHSAAISDYLPKKAKGKIRSGKKLNLSLTPLPKLIDAVRELETGKRGILVKFKLEVGKNEKELVTIGKKSAADSDADMIVMNSKERINNESGKHQTIILDLNGNIIGRGKTKAHTAEVLATLLEKKLKGTA